MNPERKSAFKGIALAAALTLGATACSAEESTNAVVENPDGHGVSVVIFNYANSPPETVQVGNGTEFTLHCLTSLYKVYKATIDNGPYKGQGGHGVLVSSVYLKLEPGSMLPSSHC